MMNNKVLKCAGHRPRLIHMLTMLMILVRHLLSLMTTLRYFHEIQSSPGVNKLLHLTMVLLSSSLENGSHSYNCFNENPSKRFRLT